MGRRGELHNGMSMRIECPLDSGNIEVISLEEASASLRIRMDNAAAFRQWFYFRCDGVHHRPLVLTLTDVGSCSYPKGWNNYRAVASYDGIDWFRVPTEYQNGNLIISHTPEEESVSYAYFAPYPLARRIELAQRVTLNGGIIETLAVTPDGHDLLCLTFGTGPAQVWIIARQHPGESMAEWFAEGLVEQLLTRGDPAVVSLLEQATLRIVPCVNPDGAYRGNHRTNARGADLNRAWLAPDRDISPEVFAIRERMVATGVALALDIHGDEEIPYNFAGGGEGTPSWSAARAAHKRLFLERWLAVSEDFQIRHGYAVPEPGTANLAICSHQLAERFGCLSLTIESPFLDHNDRPNVRTGWSPERAMRLGASVLHPIKAALL